tara:strand:- start:299 stop:757 length:459 start_codon:yes stop_codon:yes gene_type:complete
MISSEALWTHEARVRDVRDVVNEALEVLGVSLRPSVRYRVLVQHPELFDPEKYTDLLAHSLGVPTEYVAQIPVATDESTQQQPPTNGRRGGNDRDAAMQQGSGSHKRCRDGKFCRNKQGGPVSDIRTIREPHAKLDRGETRVPEEKKGRNSE